jgi:hypothetical protein
VDRSVHTITRPTKNLGWNGRLGNAEHAVAVPDEAEFLACDMGQSGPEDVQVLRKDTREPDGDSVQDRDFVVGATHACLVHDHLCASGFEHRVSHDREDPRWGKIVPRGNVHLGDGRLDAVQPAIVLSGADHRAVQGEPVEVGYRSGR